MKNFRVEEIAINDFFSINHYIPKNSKKDIVIVCFDEIQGGLKKLGFGIKFFMSNNIEAFFISHKSRSFYQDLSEDELSSFLYPYLSDKKVFTYGASLGGYAAIYYANSLNAKPIAFSPRCSIDPIYKNHKVFGVDFKHIPLSEKIIEDYKEPIVIIDTSIKKDRDFFEKRIFPLYGDKINKITMNSASHFTAAVMNETGILKSFILNIIEKGSPPEIKFDYTNSSISLSIKSLDESKKGDFEKANFYLKKIINMDNHSWGNSRLKSYKILIKKNKLKHVFKKSSILKKEIAYTLNEYCKKIKDIRDTKEILLFQLEMYILLMEYDSAKVLAEKIVLVYSEKDNYSYLIDDINDMIANSKTWII